MNASLMTKIGVRLSLDVFIFLICVRHHVGGQLLNDGEGVVRISPSSNPSNYLVSDGLICPPCKPSDCEISAISLFNTSQSEQIFDQNNSSAFDFGGKRCPNDGIPQLDDCGCCVVCVRRPNETCGGVARRLGSCQPGSTCWPILPAKGTLLTGSEGGTCIELLDLNCATPVESKGCNLHAKRGCVCATLTACQAVDFQYAEENECRKDWRKLKAMWQQDCLKAKCNVVFQPHCPLDSVFSPAPPPEPPDCCQKPGSCECVPEACPNTDVLKSCPHGSDLVLTKKATGKPGSCCDIYECHSRGDECGGVICPADMVVNEASIVQGNEKTNDDCPPDSFRPLAIRGKDRCCPVRDECRCRPGLCRPADCASGFRVIVRKKGAGVPGACCDDFECVENQNTVKRRPITCEYEGKSYGVGDTWRPSACTECTCKDGVNLCRKMECASSTCTRMIVPEGECCPVCIGCTSEEGDIHNVTEEWQKDDCTTCICETNGQVLCQKQLCKVECDHPVKVPGECCPKCDKPLIITLPQVCPSIELCPLRCEYGLKRNDRGCFLCECQTDTSSVERDHYDQTSTSEPSQSSASSRRNCSSFDGWTCSKKCAHGYEHDINGCPTCKCKGCPPIHQCYKHCLHGFQKNIYGCAICKCKGTNLESSSSKSDPEIRFGSHSNDLSSASADLSACHSMTGGVRDHGEWWFDGCRHCYCDNGLEYCSLLACPPLNCTDPVYEDGACCPRCPGSSQEGLVQRLVCHAPGSGRSYVEGEYWDLEPCVRCTCHVGHVLCHKKLCPPAPCSNPTTKDGQCCPVCEDLKLPELGAAENVTFCQSHSAASAYADGSIWKTSPCESCMCRDSQIGCFKQPCPLTGCTGRLLQVKHECCPVCTGNLENGACRFSDSVVYSVGEQWRDGPCRNCTCVGDGETLCTQVECPRCFNTTPIPGQCCPQCNDDDYPGGNSDWKGWTTLPSSTINSRIPELTGSHGTAPQANMLLGAGLAVGVIGILLLILLAACWWWWKRGQRHPRLENCGFRLWQRNGAAPGARLTNFTYDPSKSIPAIVDERNNYQYEQKTLLNTDANGDVGGKGNNNIANRSRPDILSSGINSRRDHSYDEHNSRSAQNGTLLYENDVGGGNWSDGKV